MQVLPTPGSPTSRNGGALVEGLDEIVDEGILRRRQPEGGVGELLCEGRFTEAEVREPGGRGHQKISLSSRWSPISRSRPDRSGPTGSKGTGAAGAAGGLRLGGRLRRAFLSGSTG